MAINTDAFKPKKPKIGDTKTTDGVKFVYKASGWKRINQQLEQQERKKKEKKVASTAAKKTVASLRENYDGKAGLPRTNRAQEVELMPVKLTMLGEEYNVPTYEDIKIKKRDRTGKTPRQIAKLEEQEKSHIERRLAIESHERYQKAIQGVGSRESRLIRSNPDFSEAYSWALGYPAGPYDDSMGPNSYMQFKEDLKIGARDAKAESRALGAVLDDTRNIKGAKVQVHNEHAISLAGKEIDLNVKSSPLGYSYYDAAEGKYVPIPERGSDWFKAQFPGSAYHNVKIGKVDSFTAEQMRDIGKPANWLEAAVDFEAFGTDEGILKNPGGEASGYYNPETKRIDTINITHQDMLRIQQGKVTTDQVFNHKLIVMDEAVRGRVWIDAEAPDDMIRDIDARWARQSLEAKNEAEQLRIKNLEEGSSLEARTYQAKKQAKIRSDAPEPSVTRLPRGVGVQKAAGKLNRARALAELGLHAQAGNIPGVFVSATALSAQLAGQNPVVQKKFAELFVEILARKQAKGAAKLVPGVDIGISANEMFGYISQGRPTQAMLSAISGAVGWVPGKGDLAAALIDTANTVIDVKRGDFSGIQDDPNARVRQQAQQRLKIKRPKTANKLRFRSLRNLN